MKIENCKLKINIDIQELLTKIKVYNPNVDSNLIQRAFDLTSVAHINEKQADGTPFVEHSLGVALILADLKVDQNALAAALLHDVLEHTNLSKKDLADEFNPEIANLVDDVSTSQRIKTKAEGEKQVDNFRKLLIATAKDFRVILIRLSEELYNLMHLESLPQKERLPTTQKAFCIYAPLAEKVGLNYFKWQIEDWAFKYQNHEAHTRIQQFLNQTLTEREKYIRETVEIIKKQLQKHHLAAQVFGRAKHIYSIYQKILRYQKENKTADLSPERIMDQLGFTILVDSGDQCYLTLGVIHKLWQPIPQHFVDYITHPKPNGYRSLHTTVLGPQGKIIEIQIKTFQMHEYNEYGPASHIFYKQQNTQYAKPGQEKINWLKNVIFWQKVQNQQEFMENLKADILGDRILVFTPKGDLIDLPKDASPLDFAYSVHTNLGNSCVGVKVNEKMVPLDYKLQNGQVCEIILAKKPKGPSADWLRLVRTPYAKGRIKKWLKENADNH